ncbi:hypothetical protein TNCV_1701341 [Trichonephila clavipes]|nr:hypothetical protein TNCV_1701341 [Trichonephila clavipes]
MSKRHPSAFKLPSIRTKDVFVIHPSAALTIKDEGPYAVIEFRQVTRDLFEASIRVLGCQNTAHRTETRLKRQDDIVSLPYSALLFGASESESLYMP